MIADIAAGTTAFPTAPEVSTAPRPEVDHSENLLDLAERTLREIMASSISDAARVAAAKEVRRRDEAMRRPSAVPVSARGKKEQAAATAEARTATGRFAVPPPPKGMN